MKRPKYKLGDIIRNKLLNHTEAIIEIYNVGMEYRYKTRHLDGNKDGQTSLITRSEWSLSIFYEVVGNVLDRRLPKEK